MPRRLLLKDFHAREFGLGVAFTLALAGAFYWTIPNMRTLAQSGVTGSGAGSATYGSSSQRTSQHGVPYSTVGSPEVSNGPGATSTPMNSFTGTTPEAGTPNISGQVTQSAPVRSQTPNIGSMVTPGGAPLNTVATGAPARTVFGIAGAPLTTVANPRDPFARLFPDTVIPPNFAQAGPNPFVDNIPINPVQTTLQRQLSAAVNTAENDAELRRQMKSVAAWLQDFTVWNSRFPSFGDTMNWAEQQLAILVPGNPYQLGGAITASANSAPSAGSVAPPTTINPTPFLVGANPGPSGRVRLYVDQSLNGNLVEQFLDDPPSTWVADPGSISAISNNQDLYIVWGAGADGLPLRDPQTGRIYIVAGRWGFPR
jgi:hypothetical protein